MMTLQELLAEKATKDELTAMVPPDRDIAKNATKEQIAGVVLSAFAEAASPTTPELLDEIAEVALKVEMTDRQIEHQFTYHAPNAEAVERMKLIRRAAGGLGQLILHAAPRGPDSATAIEHLRTAVMFANAAIVLRR